MMERRIIKDALSDDNVIEILQELGSSSPVRAHNSLIFDTICHNSAGSGSRKLYYYMDTKLFRCYTDCGEGFDIFSLIARVFRQRNIQLNLTQSILWIQNRIKIDYFATAELQVACSDMEFKREINFYDGQILNYLSFYPVKDWKEEGISINTMLKYGIKFNPVTSAVIIPHYDINKNLIGIRQRTMAEDEEVLGKYRPAYINGKTYPHPLSFNLYGLDVNHASIREKKRAVVFEGEKSVLKMDIFSNSCAVACCGSSLSAIQVQLLLSLGVEEIVIAFDKEFLESGDSLFEKQVKALQAIYSKFNSKVLVSFIFDKFNKLGYKESPIDRGIETFEFLYKKRFSL